jgi:hypothetical protein
MQVVHGEELSNASPHSKNKIQPLFVEPKHKKNQLTQSVLLTAKEPNVNVEE